MRQSFVHRTLPATIRFGANSRAELPGILKAAGLNRALVLTAPEQADIGHDMQLLLDRLCIGHFANARMHTPVTVTDEAVEQARLLKADCLIAVGGGSTTGLGKAIAIRTGLPQFVIPTTYAGSEVTPILGETENGRKTTRRDDAILPGYVIYDPELTVTLPVAISVTSGVNAIAHAVEALYAPDSTPIITLMARDARAAMARALPAIHADPRDAEARGDALYSAWLCGTCLGNTAMGLHHKICHVLGGTFDLSHAPTHCIMLPHVLAYNRQAAPMAYAETAAALGVPDASTGLFEFIGSLDGPRALRDIGMPETGIGEVVNQLLASPYVNPAPLNAGRLTAMLNNAWAGNSPVG